MHGLISLWNTIQLTLFPWLEEELDPLTERQKHFVSVIELIKPERFLQQFCWIGNGRKPKRRLNLLKAFVAKAVYDFQTTEILVEHLKSCKNLRRLCGWETIWAIPSLSTFSRAFTQFSESEVLNKIHRAMIVKNYGDKIAGHVSRDSTAIEAREKPAKKEPKVARPKGKRGRRKKGEQAPPVEPKRLELQPDRSLEANIADLPQACNVGTKKNSKGYKESWIGYKLHADVVDGEIPVSLILTSASLHDSQVAIPLAQMTASRVTNLYDLMDAAYDSEAIHRYALDLGHIALIDSNPRSGEKVLMDPAQEARYNQRTSVERVFSMLKDNHGGRHVRVRGPKKVMAHLMFGMLVVTATQFFRLLI
ncbi:transposase [Desulfatirhabdium butyrativorans]|uniref:transposase n=2 Tax=Desulfatirhabdium butyrativorans TaxID=340467 RepID=UPI0004232614|nr:transposase [Desulfatirhabdium butyrativorans]